MRRKVIVILIVSLFPSALLNGYAGACPLLAVTAANESQPETDAPTRGPLDEKPIDEPPEDDAPSTGGPLLGLPTVSSASFDHPARSIRTFAPVRSRTLPVGLWHGQSLSVPRPFSRLDRVVAMSACDASNLARVARHLRPHAPPALN